MCICLVLCFSIRFGRCDLTSRRLQAMAFRTATSLRHRHVDSQWTVNCQQPRFPDSGSCACSIFRIRSCRLQRSPKPGHGRSIDPGRECRLEDGLAPYLLIACSLAHSLVCTLFAASLSRLSALFVLPSALWPGRRRPASRRGASAAFQPCGRLSSDWLSGTLVV